MLPFSTDEARAKAEINFLHSPKLAKETYQWKLADEVDRLQATVERLSSIPTDVAAILRKWSKPSHFLLHAGEMSAQEKRSVRAVIDGMRAEVLSYLPPDAP